MGSEMCIRDRFWADQQGLDNVYKDLLAFGEKYGGPAWEPAPLLKRLAEEGKSFADYQAGA